MKKNRKETILKPALILFLVSFSFLFGFSARAATSIFRSVGPSNTSDMNSDSRTVYISGSTATFSDTMSNNIGVGDVLVYDPGSGTTLAFISGRISSTVFTVQAADGTAPESSEEGTVVSVYRAYTSLSDAESGTENTSIGIDFDSWTDGKDLVVADQQWNIACYGDAEDTTLGVVINGWTTDDDNNIKIFTPYLSSQVGTSQRHSGVWDDGKYKLVVSDDFPDGSPISINTGSDTSSVNVWIDGLQIFTNSQISNSFGVEAYNVTGETKISNSIIKSDPLLTSNNGIYIHNLTHHGTYKLWNNIIYGFTDGGIDLHDSDNTLYAYNNTVYGSNGSDVCYKQSGGTFVAKNNIAQNCSDGYDGTFDNSSTNNLSDLASDAPGSNPQNEASVTFIDSGNDNYKLDSSDTAAMDQGETLSSDGYLPFSSDIENQARGTSWDIGADEYASSDSTPPTLSEVIPVATPGNDTTPDYTFSSTEVGNITYGGDCSSSASQAISGNNTVTFSTLSEGTHSNCTIRVTDAAGNTSNALNVSSFIIDITHPTLSEITAVSTPTADTTPDYTFSSNEAGTIACGGGCSCSGFTSAISGDNTITFDNLSAGTYDSCTISVTDSAGNSSQLSVSSFTITSESTESSIINNEEDEDINRDLDVHSVKFIAGVSAIQVEWKTKYNSNSKVKFGTDRNIKKYKKKSQKTKKHKILIKNLIPDTVYYLQVKSSDDYGNEDKSRIYLIRTNK